MAKTTGLSEKLFQRIDLERVKFNLEIIAQTKECFISRPGKRPAPGAKSPRGESTSSGKKIFSSKKKTSSAQEEEFTVEDIIDFDYEPGGPQPPSLQEQFELKKNFRAGHIRKLHEGRASQGLKQQLRALEKEAFLKVYDAEKNCGVRSESNVLGQKHFDVLNLEVIGELDLAGAMEHLDLLTRFSKEVNLKNSHDMLWNIWGILLNYQSALARFFNSRLVFQIFKFDALRNIFFKIRFRVINRLVLHDRFGEYLRKALPGEDFRAMLSSARKPLRSSEPVDKRIKPEPLEPRWDLGGSEIRMDLEYLFSHFDDPESLVGKTRKEVYGATRPAEEARSKWENDPFCERLDREIMADIERYEQSLYKDTLLLLDEADRGDETRVDLERFQCFDKSEETRPMASFLYRDFPDPFSNVVKTADVDDESQFPRIQMESKCADLELAEALAKSSESWGIHDQMRRILALLRESSSIIEDACATYLRVKAKILDLLESLLVNFGFSTLEQRSFARMDLFSIADLKSTSLIRSLVQNNFTLLETKGLFDLSLVFEDFLSLVAELSSRFEGFCGDFPLSRWRQ